MNLKYILKKVLISVNIFLFGLGSFLCGARWGSGAAASHSSHGCARGGVFRTHRRRVHELPGASECARFRLKHRMIMMLL